MPQKPDNNPKGQNGFLIIFKNLGAQLLLFIFIICLLYVANKPEIVTMTFTNIGFAVFLALANTCFSWSRSLTGDIDKDNADTINTVAMLSIFCALTFVVSSILHLVINNTGHHTQQIIGAKYFYFFLKILRVTLISIVLMFGFGIIIQLLLIIVKKLYHSLVDDSDKKMD